MRAVGFGAAVTVLAHSTPLMAAECTQKQVNTVDCLSYALPSKCNLQLYSFDVCDDECLAAYKEKKQEIPDGSLPDHEVSPYEAVQEDYETCKSTHALTADKYMPLASKGSLAACTSDQMDEWYSRFGWNASYNNCWSLVTPATGCSDECLSMNEQGVSASPACADSSGYWYGEIQKLGLIRCLKARNNSLRDNVVLNTVGNADGSKTLQSVEGGKPNSGLVSSGTRATKGLVVGSVMLLWLPCCCRRSEGR